MSEVFVTAEEIPHGYMIPFPKHMQPKLLAELFCNLDSSQQAQFFDRIAEIDKEHWERKGVFQWRSMQDDLTDRAHQVIVDLYEHTNDGE